MAWQLLLDDRGHEDAPLRSVNVQLFRDGRLRWNHEAVLDVNPTAAELERLRWYFEDFPSDPYEPAPRLADEARGQLRALGSLLRDSLVATVREPELEHVLSRAVAETEVRVRANPVGLPWEALLDSSETPLAVIARQVVRTVGPQLPGSANGRTARLSGRGRVLIVVSRPAGARDVRFQAVARPLLATLQHFTDLRVDVLRPPTYPALLHFLADARNSGDPIELVHFDGHGVTRNGTGHLVFEPTAPGTPAPWIPGRRLGTDLARHGVSVAVLNACRSAFSGAADGNGSMRTAFRSLAEELVAAGVSGVVAMQYDVMVTTAARLVAPLYAQLGLGASVGEAITVARRSLHSDLLERQTSGDPLRLDDWFVPLAYTTGEEPFVSARTDSERPAVEIAKPPVEDRFVGRDEDLLTLDRSFDESSVVVLSGMAGAGKSALARRFADWYTATGGAPGGTFHVRSIFEPAKDTIAALGGHLEGSQALTGALVVIDAVNLTPLEEREQFNTLLRRLVAAGAKALVLSHTGRWISQARHLRLGPLQDVDAIELLARELGEPLDESTLAAWRPVLECASGSPLALRTLTTWANALPRAMGDELRALVDSLVGGQSPKLPPEAELAVSVWPRLVLEQKDWDRLVAVLHHQGYFEINHLRLLGTTDGPVHVPELADVDSEVWFRLTGACCAVGLMWQAHNTYFEVHPLLPAAIAEHARPSPERAALWERAWTTMAASLGHNIQQEYVAGHQRALTLKWAASEEPNLRHALERAMRRGWWDLVSDIASGLEISYLRSGREREWRQVLNRLGGEAITAQGEPRGGRDELWRRVALWEQAAANEARDLPTAISWGRQLVDHWRGQGGGYNLAVVLHVLGISRCLTGDPRCVEDLEEALHLLPGDDADRPLRAAIEFNLGLAYQDIPSIADLDAALACFRRSFELQHPEDGLNRGKCAGQAGQLLVVAAETASDDPQRRQGLLEGAMMNTLLALQLLPPSAMEDRCLSFARLGKIHQLQGRWADALEAHRAARAGFEAVGNSRGQAMTRLAIAEDLRGLQRFEEARVYATAARGAFAASGPSGAAGTRAAQRLLRELDERP